MLPPHNMPLGELSREEGISEGSLSRWRAQAGLQGQVPPDAAAGPGGWTTRDKFAVVVETAAIKEVAFSQYRRQRGLYPGQVQAGRSACDQANDRDRAASRHIARETKDDRKRIRDPERELGRKEKALAKAAALMVLKEKADAIRA